MRAGWRQRRVVRLSRALEARSNPRFALFFIIFVSGVSGLLASIWLLHLGLTHMGMRYPLALLAAYGVFLTLLWLWLRTRDDHSDIVDLPSPNTGGGNPALSECELPALRPGGGNFGAGGASAEFDGGDIVEAAVITKTEVAKGAVESAAVAAGEGCGVVVLVLIGVVALGAFPGTGLPRRNRARWPSHRGAVQKIASSGQRLLAARYGSAHVGSVPGDGIHRWYCRHIASLVCARGRDAWIFSAALTALPRASVHER